MLKRKEVFMNYLRYNGRNYVNMAERITEIRLNEGMNIIVPPYEKKLYYEMNKVATMNNDIKIIPSLIMESSIHLEPATVDFDDYKNITFAEYETIIFGKNLIMILSTEQSKDYGYLEYDENFVMYDGIKYINVTKSSILLKMQNGDVFVLPPSGIVIDASVVNVPSFDVGDRIVVRHEKRIENWLKSIKYSDIVILGDKATSIAYSGLVYYCTSFEQQS